MTKRTAYTGVTEASPSPLYAEIDRLRAELAAAQKDAERYRWMRDKRDYSVICERAGDLYLRMPNELDAAIDAAMKEGK